MRRFVIASILLLACITPGLARELKIVTTIKPVHALVASVMAGVGDPYLIIKGGASPHAYSMKPSDAEALQEADLLFWIGHDLELFLRGPIETLAKDAELVALDSVPGLLTLPLREGGAFEAHEHEGEHEDEHDEHGHADEHEHADEHGHEEEHEHEAHEDEMHEDEMHEDEINMHLWLDPENAKLMVREIEVKLTAADPENGQLYKANADKTLLALDALMVEIDAQLAPLGDKAFIVFHDAYHYFENRFGLTAAGSITVSPEIIPGVKRIVAIRRKIKTLDVACVFSEPQFEPKLVATVTEGTHAKTGVLDPLGAELEAGPEAYFTLMRKLTSDLEACLAG